MLVASNLGLSSLKYMLLGLELFRIRFCPCFLKCLVLRPRVFFLYSIFSFLIIVFQGYLYEQVRHCNLPSQLRKILIPTRPILLPKNKVLRDLDLNYQILHLNFFIPHSKYPPIYSFFNLLSYFYLHIHLKILGNVWLL